MEVEEVAVGTVSQPEIEVEEVVPAPSIMPWVALGAALLLLRA